MPYVQSYIEPVTLAFAEDIDGAEILILQAHRDQQVDERLNFHFHVRAAANDDWWEIDAHVYDAREIPGHPYPDRTQFIWERGMPEWLLGLIKNGTITAKWDKPIGANCW